MEWRCARTNNALSIQWQKIKFSKSQCFGFWSLFRQQYTRILCVRSTCALFTVGGATGLSSFQLRNNVFLRIFKSTVNLSAHLLTPASHFCFFVGENIPGRLTAHKRFPVVDNYPSQHHKTTDKHAGFNSDPQKVIYSLPAKPRLRRRGFVFLSAPAVLYL